MDGQCRSSSFQAVKIWGWLQSLWGVYSNSSQFDDGAARHIAKLLYNAKFSAVLCPANLPSDILDANLLACFFIIVIPFTI